ncbi:Cytochrome c-type biogenesis protein CcsA/ResC [Actinomycetales bacterium JB111]|nr:Cytochrome c-type biogenesis protein CcsA/ResC [Actinomycetales bacterium JB111]
MHMPESTLAQVSTSAIYGAMAAYAIAMIVFAVDLARLADKAEQGRRFANIGMSVLTMGAVIHAVGVITRAVATKRVPWANMYEFSIVFTLVAVVLFLGFSRKFDLRYLGTFLLLPILLSLGLAVSVLYVRADGVPPALDSYWLIIHVFVATCAVGVLGLSAVFSVVQLVQERAEIGRAKRASVGTRTAELVPAGGAAEAATGTGGTGSDEAAVERTGFAAWRERLSLRLPSSAQFERMSFRLIAVGFVLWTFTLIAGAIWAEHAWGRPWGWDIKEVWTLIVWIVYAAYLHARLTRGWEGRRAAYLSLAGFGLILANYFVVNLFLNSRHAYSGLG